MQLVSLNIFLHIIFASMTRMLQGIMPFHINLSKIRSYAQPWILPDFKFIRVIFSLLVFYNAFVLSRLFFREILIPYYVLYIMIIAWVHPFTNTKFYHAFKIMLFCTLYATVLVIEFPILMPNAIWCIYLLYTSSWYNWCLPI
jgi:hypothetical protein